VSLEQRLAFWFSRPGSCRRGKIGRIDRGRHRSPPALQRADELAEDAFGQKEDHEDQDQPHRGASCDGVVARSERVEQRSDGRSADRGPEPVA